MSKQDYQPLQLDENVKKEQRDFANKKVLSKIIYNAIVEGWDSWEEKFASKKLKEFKAQVREKKQFTPVLHFGDSSRSEILDTIAEMIDSLQAKQPELEKKEIAKSLQKALQPYVLPSEEAKVSRKTSPEEYPVSISYDRILSDRQSIEQRIVSSNRQKTYIDTMKDALYTAFEDERIISAGRGTKEALNKLVSVVKTPVHRGFNGEGNNFLLALLRSDPNFRDNTDGIDGVERAAGNMVSMLYDIAIHKPDTLKRLLNNTSVLEPENSRNWSRYISKEGGLYSRIFEKWEEISFEKRTGLDRKRENVCLDEVFQNEGFSEEIVLLDEEPVSIQKWSNSKIPGKGKDTKWGEYINLEPEEKNNGRGF